MRGRLIRDFKLKGPSALGGAILVMVALVGMGLILNRVLFEAPDQPGSVEVLDKMSTSVDSAPPVEDASEKSTDKMTISLKNAPPDTLASPQSTLVQNQAPNQAGSEARSGDELGTQSGAIAASPGVLRVGNLTEHPLRVALLLRRPMPGNAPSVPTPNAKPVYEPPAHWDFEPGEGSQKGLLLSLPNRKLKLKKGDILVAFAQDGSRRYWGPYVVGETSVPTWRSQTAEWELILEP